MQLNLFHCIRSRQRVKPTLIRKYSSIKSPKPTVDLNLINFGEIRARVAKARNECDTLYWTKNIQDASQVLRDMYNSLPESHPVKVYLRKNCVRLFSLQEIMDDRNLKIDFANHEVNSQDKQGHPSSYKGCYIFYNL